MFLEYGLFVCLFVLLPEMYLKSGLSVQFTGFTSLVFPFVLTLEYTSLTGNFLLYWLKIKCFV